MMKTGFSHRSEFLSYRLLVIVTFAMLIALAVTVYSVLHEVDFEAEEVLDAWQIRVAEDLLRQTTTMIRAGRHNDAWLVLETARGMGNAWLSEFVSSPALLFGHRESVDKDNEVKAYVWLVAADGSLTLGSPMPDYRKKEGETKGIHSLEWSDHEWRIAFLTDESGAFRVFVAQRDDLHDYLAREVGSQTMKLQLVLIPMVVLVLWLGIRRGLAPLSRLGRQIANRRPGNLQPVALKDVPGEILPVVHSINDLLERLRVTLESERSFTSNAAHELRSPLAVIRNLSRIMGDADDLQQVHQSSDLLDQSVSRMADMLSQLLHLARLDSVTMDTQASPVYLRDAVESVVALAMPDAVIKSVDIAYNAELEVFVRTDAQLLKVMFANLLSNALKYGKDGGSVMIRVHCPKDDLLIEILDDGSGVEPECLAHLFERFYRTAKAKQLAQGTGLGLAIAKRIAELHDADIWAENRDHGGLKIIIRVPQSRWGRVTEDHGSRPTGL